MAKRFIDTEMFCDEWFSELSKDAKLFFIYFITTCDHAGVLKLNKKLCEFQTGLKNIDTVIKELGNSLVTVKEQLYFMPKFIKFQYPNFPNSAVKQQDSALKLLKQYGFWNEELNSYLTVSQELVNYYDNVSDSGSSIVLSVYKPKKCFFKDSEIFDKVKFKESFPEWQKDKLAYYYEQALTWSNEGNKKIDWKATVRTWANRDEKLGKLKFASKNNNNQLGGLLT